MTLLFTADIATGWHVYSQDNDPLDGPIPTSIVLYTEGIESPRKQKNARLRYTLTPISTRKSSPLMVNPVGRWTLLGKASRPLRSPVC